MTQIQWVSLAGSLIFLLIVLDAVRKQKLREAYSLLWIVITIGMIVVSIRMDLLRFFSDLLGIVYPPATLFLLLCVGICLLLFQYSIVISLHNEKSPGSLRRSHCSGKNGTKGKAVKISIVTPVRNGKRFIRQTVESVLNQQGEFELEYIVCDGQSTDGTLEILAGYPECTVISRKDGGPFHAINYGMDLASGDIGAWLNADDIYLPGTLAKVARCFQEHPGTGWLYGNCPIIDETGGKSAGRSRCTRS